MGNGLHCVKRQLSALTLTNNIHTGLSKASNNFRFVLEVNAVALINYVNHSKLAFHPYPRFPCRTKKNIVQLLILF